MKLSRVGELWISAGREFQRVGAAMLKALSPKVLSLVRGIERRPASDDRRFWAGVCCERQVFKATLFNFFILIYF